jgi:2-dehydropantoate 2-reductase
MNMRTIVIGAGGVGGYFGGKLAKAGNEVVFIARGIHCQIMRKNGLMVKSIHGDFHVENVNVQERIADGGKADLVLLGVKAWQIREIREELKSVIHPQTIIIPLQNGIMAFDELSEVIPAHNVLKGLCRIISKIEAPGVINHFGVNPIIIFGEAHKQITPRLQVVKDLFDQADIPCQISPDMDAELWKKFIAICVSGLLAVCRANYGEIRSIPQTRQMMIDLVNEIYTLSLLENINIPRDFVEKTISFIDTFPPESTSSLTRDVWEGKPSEIDYQNGTVLKLAHKHGLETPVNRFVFNSILPSEIRARKE